MPAILVSGHAPFCWGISPHEAAHAAMMLEEVAHMAYMSISLNLQTDPISDSLLNKHFLRKHGSAAYYGQPKKKNRG
jgi:L-ribulose-5-phosphate 4-epimerase